MALAKTGVNRECIMYPFFDGKVFAIIFARIVRAWPVLGYGLLTYRSGWPLPAATVADLTGTRLLG
jgi:hypothetical protein